MHQKGGGFGVCHAPSHLASGARLGHAVTSTQFTVPQNVSLTPVPCDVVDTLLDCVELIVRVTDRHLADAASRVWSFSGQSVAGRPAA